MAKRGSAGINEEMMSGVGAEKKPRAWAPA